MKIHFFKIKKAVYNGILDRLVPEKIFSQLTVANKVLLGYTAIGLLMIIVVIYALISFQRLNQINRSIVQSDIVVQTAADQMLNAVLAQDMYEKRYMILKSKDMRELYVKRGKEFRSWLSSLDEISEYRMHRRTIENLYNHYDDLVSREMQLMTKRLIKEATIISNGNLKETLDKLLDSLRGLSASAKSSQDSKMKLASNIVKSAFGTTATLWVISILIGALAVLIVTHHISSSMNKLKIATEQIAQANFDYDPEIRTHDEIGSLATAFMEMGKRLRKLEEMYLDASPLTRLPGGIAIENVLKKRLESCKPLAFCLLDLDNFKPFSDFYGYAHGSEVIKETAKIIEQAVRIKGSPDDFIGHIGGDDFVVITTPRSMREISNEIIRLFDERAPAFYNESDRTRGYILGKTRQGVEMQFPLMTISVAIVTNERRKITNPLEASEIAAELKEYAKSIPRSTFVIDERREA